MRVFISRLSALGDVTCTLPVAVALRKLWPDAEIVWAVDRRFSGIVACCPSVNQVVEWPKNFGEARRLAGTLGEFDIALDMQGLLKSALPVFFVKAKRKMGYHWQREGSWLFSQKVRPDPTSFHVVDQYVDVARTLGAEVDRAEFDLHPFEEDISFVEQKLMEEGRDEARPLVICHAGAGWATKRWPPESFADLSRFLNLEGYEVAFLGTKADRASFDDVRRFKPGPVLDLLGKTNVRELVALLSLAQLHVAGDTGSIHIASALGVPCLGLYTMTKPERSCPYGNIAECRTVDLEEVKRNALRLLRSGGQR